MNGQRPLFNYNTKSSFSLENLYEFSFVFSYLDHCEMCTDKMMY